MELIFQITRFKLKIILNQQHYALFLIKIDDVNKKFTTNIIFNALYILPLGSTLAKFSPYK
jgi:hypothetical protein